MLVGKDAIKDEKQSSLVEPVELLFLYIGCMEGNYNVCPITLAGLAILVAPCAS